MSSPTPGPKALVTGATGFVGAHLSRHLRSLGWEVHVMHRGRLTPEFCVDAGGMVVHAISGPKDLAAVLAQSAPDVVFHLAAHFVGEHGPGEVGELVEGNVLFTAELCEAMRRAGTSRLVFAGTVWEQFHGTEVAANLYAATKRAAREVIRYYGDAHAWRTITLRLTDTYGPGDRRKKLLHALRSAAQSQTPLPLSPGGQLVDFVHIDDVVRAFSLAGERLVANEAPAGADEQYVVASGKPRTLQALVAAVAELVRIEVDWGARPYRQREVMVPWDDGSRVPGWEAEVSLEAGLRTLAWPEDG